MGNHLEQQVIRTVMALCAFGVQSADADVRDDMHQEASALLCIWLGPEMPEHLRRWCDRLASRLEFSAAVAPYTAVLRLRVLLAEYHPPVARSVEPKKQEKSLKPPGEKIILGVNQKKVLRVVREHPDMRTMDVVNHFSGSLSDRTVKRCLKDLVAGGFLVRSKNDTAISYRLTAEVDML